jgi:hypothetical protein
MKEAFISIMRQEQQELETRILAEQQRPHPDENRLDALKVKEEASSLRRQLDRIDEH